MGRLTGWREILIPHPFHRAMFGCFFEQGLLQGTLEIEDKHRSNFAKLYIKVCLFPRIIEEFQLRERERERVG